MIKEKKSDMKEKKKISQKTERKGYFYYVLHF